MQEEVSARFLHTWSQTPLTSARFLHTRSQPGPSSGTTITARAPLVATFYKNAANIDTRGGWLEGDVRRAHQWDTVHSKRLCGSSQVVVQDV